MEHAVDTAIRPLLRIFCKYISINVTGFMCVLTRLGSLHKPSLLAESFDFIKSVNRRRGPTPALYSHFPLKYWTSTECLISSVFFYVQAHADGAQSYTYGVNCNRRVVEKILCMFDNTDYYCSQLYNSRPFDWWGSFLLLQIEY
jgi:hypothetical protein